MQVSPWLQHNVLRGCAGSGINQGLGSVCLRLGIQTSEGLSLYSNRPESGGAVSYHPHGKQVGLLDMSKLVRPPPPAYKFLLWKRRPCFRRLAEGFFFSPSKRRSHAINSLQWLRGMEGETTSWKRVQSSADLVNQLVMISPGYLMMSPVPVAWSMDELPG